MQYCGIKRLIEMAIEGFNSTVFCYGQTGSGKTHTLTGPPHLVITYNVECEMKDPKSKLADSDCLAFEKSGSKQKSRTCLNFKL